MKPITDVDAYIADAPKDMQARLKEIRAAIRAAAPGGEERISYGMPTYEHKGRLIYFSLWKSHLAFYALSRRVLDEYQSELEGFVTPKGAVRFPLAEKLPIALIKKLMKAQFKKNAE